MDTARPIAHQARSAIRPTVAVLIAAALLTSCSSHAGRSGSSSEADRPAEATWTSAPPLESTARAPTTTTQGATVVTGDGAAASDISTTTTATSFDTNGTDPDPELSKPFPAYWSIDPSFTPTPETMSLPLLVTEIQCASGISPIGRIETSVDYTLTEVDVSVIVDSVGGFADCQGIDPTPFTLQLTEPLGHRTIVGENPSPLG